MKADLEVIAEAVHNAWWEEKKRQGYENHPDMLPYSELSESVKDYDRVTAKAVMMAMEVLSMEKINWKQKLSSRKFWVALAGFVSALMVACNIAETDIIQVTAIISAFGTLIIYILSESYVDGKRAEGSDEDE